MVGGGTNGESRGGAPQVLGSILKPVNTIWAALGGAVTCAMAIYRS